MDLDIFDPKPVDTTGLLEMEQTPNPAATDAAESVRMLDSPGAVIPGNVMSERSRLIANWGLQTSTDKIVSAPTPEAEVTLPQLATRYNSSDPDDVQYGVYSMLSEQDNDDIPPVAENAQEYKEMMLTKGQKRIMALGQAAKEANEAARLPMVDKNPLAVFGDEALNMFTPTNAQRLVNAIKTVVPTAGGAQRADVGGVVNDLQNRWVEMTNKDERGASQAILEMNQVITAIRGQADTFFSSDAQYQDLVDRLTGTMTDLANNPDAGITNKMNTFMGWAEVLTLPVARTMQVLSKTTRLLSPGLAPGKGAFLLAQTRTGASRLWAAVRNKELDGKHIQNGMTTADVIASLATPKAAAQPLDNIPNIYSEFVPEADRAAAMADPAEMFGTHLAPRVTGTKLDTELLDGGYSGTVHFGTTKGKGFSNAPTADRWAQKEFGKEVPYKTVQVGNQWYVEATKIRQWGLDDIAAKVNNPTRPGYSLLRLLGKAPSVNTDLAVGSSIAAREGDKAVAGMRDLMEPFFGMVPGSRARVADVLDKGDAARKVYSVDELRNDFGLNDTEIKGYASVRRATDTQRTMENIRLGMKADAQGYKNSFVVNGHGPITLRTVTANDVANTTKKALGNVRAVDVATGNAVSLDKVADTHEIVQFMHPLRTGERFGILAKSDMNKLAPRPFELIPDYPGYLPRPYKYPWYVKQFDENGVANTMMPARSVDEAEQLAADLRKSNPGHTIEPVRAVELREGVEDADAFAQLYEANLLSSNTRGPSRLTDVTNKTRMFTVEDRIRSLMSDVSYSVGLGRWALVQEKLWNNTYAARLGTKFSLGMDTATIKATTAGGEKVLHEARKYADFIQHTAGMGRWSKGLLSTGIRNRIADIFYNVGTRFNSKAALTVGDSVSGLRSVVTPAARTAAYVAYLATNPIRQLPLQMTMIPSYMGIKGGARYIGMGKYFQDQWTLLSEFLSPGSVTSKEGRELLKQWERSGVKESVDSHIFTLQTFGDGANVGGGRGEQVKDALSATLRMTKNVGINAGIYMDKQIAWLMSRNRWLTVNKGKKIDGMAERQIAAWANDLNLNPDRSDVLPILQSGPVLSTLTQFMGQQVKVIGRLAQAATGGGPFTRVENLRMGGTQLMMWGLTGFGFGAFARKLMDDPELEAIPESAKQIVTDGFVNWGINTFVNSYEEGSNKTDLAITDSFSPVNHIGGTIKGFMGLAEMFATGDPQLLIESNWRAPALGLGASGYQVAKLGYMLAGIPDNEAAGVNEWTKMQAIGMEAAKKLPIANNTIQMLATLEYGKKFNSRGNPQTEATLAEALAKLYGVNTREEVEARRLQLFAFPTKRTAEKEERDVKQWAQENANYLFPLWEQVVDNKINPREAFKLANEVNMFAYTALPDEYKTIYINELQRLWGFRGKDKLESLVQVVLDPKNGLGSAEMPATANTLDVINSLDISAEQKFRLTERIRAVTAGSNPKE